MPRPVGPFSFNSYATSDKEEDQRLFRGFYHDGSSLPLIVLKIILGIVLVPLKLLLFVLGLLVIVPVCMILKPKHHKRSLFYGPRMKIIALMSRILAKWCTLVCGIYIKKEGNVVLSYEGHKPIVISNHTSFVDIPVTSSVLGCAYICKQGTSRLPVFDLLSEAVDCIYVERTSKESCRQASEALQKRAKDSSQTVICVFPEGTTSSGQQLLTFKSGAFRAGMPVQPMAIKYNSPFGNVAWDIQNGLLAFLGFLTCPFIIVTVKFMPIYVPNEEEKANPRVFANNVRKLMALELGRPQDYPFGLEDKFSYRAYYKGNVSYEDAKAEIVARHGTDVLSWGKSSSTPKSD